METMILPVTELLLVGVITEALVEIIKDVTPRKLSDNGIKLISLFIGVGLSLMLHISIFTGVPQYVALIGSVICGMIASRGSNVIHSFSDAIASISERLLQNKK